MDAAAKPLLRVRDLRVSYGLASVVKGVSFTLRRGETAAIAGKSGSGKTQTVLAALQLLPRQAVTTGLVIFEDTELLALSRRRLEALLGRRIAMVFQEPMSSLDPLFTVGAQIGAILRTQGRPLTPRGQGTGKGAFGPRRHLGAGAPRPFLSA